MTAKKITTLIVLIPIAILLVSFIVANREDVSLTLNPFNPMDENLTYHAPLFIWLFLFLGFGALLGSVTTWFTQYKYRKMLKNCRNELRILKKDINTQLKHL